MQTSSRNLRRIRRSEKCHRFQSKVTISDIENLSDPFQPIESKLCAGSRVWLRACYTQYRERTRRPNHLGGKMKKRESGFTLIELLIVIAIIGILAAIAIPNLLNAVQRGKQKRTMSDMRALATAVEAYAVDNNKYPAAACAAGVFSTGGTEVTLDSSSFSALSPTYIAQPPKSDGWGR